MTESVVISFFSGFQHREKLLLNVLVRQGEKVHFFFSTLDASAFVLTCQLKGLNSCTQVSSILLHQGARLKSFFSFGFNLSQILRDYFFFLCV